MVWWKWVLCAVIGYLLGSFSTGVLLSRREGCDIRNEGSHNTGASNVLRVMGVKDGAITFLGDFIKAALAVIIGRLLGGIYGGMVGGLFVVLGHNWPVFFGFKGGKGIACSTAVVLLTFPWQGAIAAVLCLIVIYLTKYISLGSLTMLFSFFVLVLLSCGIWPEGVWALVLLLLAVYRHRSNIQRLLKGTENKISFKKKSGNKPAA